jgi:hypothetical protein
VKTTLEIPDTIFRRAKSIAARDGKSLKQFVNEALEAKLQERAAPGVPEWRRLFGAMRGHRAELRKIDAAISAEFETIDPEDWT